VAISKETKPESDAPLAAAQIFRDRGVMRAMLATSITAMVVTGAVAGFAIHSASHGSVQNPNFDAYAVIASALHDQQLAAATPAPAQYTQAPTPTAPHTPTPSPVVQSAPIPTVQHSMEAPIQGVQQEAVSRIATMLDQPDIAGPLVAKLTEASGILSVGEISGSAPVIAFIDPRCPYCHKAYEALNGKVDVLWLPTLALGSPQSGEPIMAGLLGQTEAVMEGGEIVAVSLVEDPERAQRLTDYMIDDKVDLDTITEAQRFVLNDNLALAAELYRFHDEPFGVPTFIVPRPDGTAAFVRGWDDRDTQPEILEAYQGEGSEG
jgi:glutaredoxin